MTNYGAKKYFLYAAADWVNKFMLKGRDDKAYVMEKQIDIKEIENIPKVSF